MEHGAEQNTRPGDPSTNPLRVTRNSLHPLFAPKSIAVIGASERPGSVGRSVLWNLISHPFGGTVFPVNARRASVLGIKAYPSIEAVPEPVDLAVLVTPAHTVPGLVRDCVAAGVKGAIIISAGFKEIGAEGVRLEQQILAEARKGALRIIGPNCLGVMSPMTGLNATFASTIARPGNVGFISQSGALLTAILDWSLHENVGFSAFVSVGSMLDVGWGDLIHYLGDDPQTRSILIYMESIGDARAFLTAARDVALRKPIIVIKAGRTKQAAQAAASHTGTLAGSDAVLSAAFRRTGILRVDSIADLFYMAEVLAKQPRPAGPRLTILTNAGGPGVLATDALIQGGGELTTLSEETREALSAFLPEHWSHSNPIDILGDADPERYARALEIAANDAQSDGLLVTLVPVGVSDPTQVAEKLKSYARLGGKPVLASWMGGADVAAGEAILNQAGIPTFAYPDTAARLFNYMWRYSYNLRGLYETPVLPEDAEGMPDRALAQTIIETARRDGQTLLTEFDAKRLLAAYGIPTVETRFAAQAEAAVHHAEEIGYPVVVKLHSKTITHKVDVGGVKLGLHTSKAVCDAFEAIQQALAQAGRADAFDGVTVQPMVSLEGYEVILGSSLDPQFGPVLLFGSGGSLVEVYQDSALGLPPLNTTLARRMMEQTKIYKALQGIRGRAAVDMETLAKLMVRFSQLVVEQRVIKEIDINPLLATPGASRLLALDARVVLHDADVTVEMLPKLAIRPYPHHYAGAWTLKDGTPVTIRPIRPEDEPKMVRFHGTLSEQSIFFRYAGLLKISQRVAHDRLARLCFIDYDHEMALVAEHEDPVSGDREIIAVGRLTKMHDTGDGEVAILVSDQHQGQGLGTELVRRLIQIGRDEGLQRLVAVMLRQNQGMQHVCRKLDFDAVPSDDLSDSMIQAVKLLQRT